MAALGVPVEALLASSPVSRRHSAQSSRKSATHSAAWSKSRIALANCRGEVFGHPVLQSSICNDDSNLPNFDRARRKLEIAAIDAAQEFDYESMKLTEMKKKNRLKVGIVGFGNFGQFLAQRFVQQGHQVLAHSRSDYGDAARKLGVIYYR